MKYLVLILLIGVCHAAEPKDYKECMRNAVLSVADGVRPASEDAVSLLKQDPVFSACGRDLEAIRTGFNQFVNSSEEDQERIAPGLAKDLSRNSASLAANFKAITYSKDVQFLYTQTNELVHVFQIFDSVLKTLTQAC